MSSYRDTIVTALARVTDAIIQAEALLPQSVRSRHWQTSKAGTQDTWNLVAFWYETQPDWQLSVSTVINHLVLLSRAQANLHTAAKSEPTTKPNTELPKVRRTP